MRLTEKYRAEGATIDYLLDTGDGEYCRSAMPADVAEEIANREAERGLDGPEGHELRAGRNRFPKAAFEFDEGEEAALTAPKPKRRGRRG